MENFDISSLASIKIYDSNQRELPIVEGFPASKKVKEETYRIQNSTAYHIAINEKNWILMQVIDLKMSIMVVTDYIIENKMTLHSVSNSPILELYATFYGGAHIHLKKSAIQSAFEGNFNLYTAPTEANIVTIDRKIRTVDHHFAPGFLERYSKKFPALKKIIQAHQNGQTASLNKTSRVMSLKSAYLTHCLINKINNDTIKDDDKYKAVKNIIKSFLRDTIDNTPTILEARLSDQHIKAIAYTFNHVEEYLENSYNMQDLAALANQIIYTTEAQIRKACKLLFNLPPMQYIRKIKMHVAKKMIRRGEKESVIAAQLGFKTLSHFETAFKSVYKMSPKQYRLSVAHKKTKRIKNQSDTMENQKTE